MCFDFLYKFCLKHFSFSEELRGYIIIYVHRSCVKKKILHILNFMKIRPGWMDGHEEDNGSFFTNLRKAPDKKKIAFAADN